ncbi:TetR/AcrR family transcriptional regulator [Kibdelosporangium philippinense]|uniref:TetR/AcrR family transcriptional regulator n=1 Tax=Kibdelosporangium philippinense TaxID=211113 RepID=A0ABS8Z668_9PSEU|nr:TetR/AcrR family transcriptional regulator [Kibdelosporangium philippinense]MCE7003383.1 TetR/AcrR family transcriptional regulator [Kibdelosporangium philippinense]
MNAARTARDRARAELTQEIKNEARRQLAIDGAQKLSLRSVARALGMVSSALYRYFPSRDELLTALIIDAYNAVGDAAEGGKVGQTPRERWTAACQAIRAWARANPHEYALIYGSPIPGYVAPADTVAAAARVPLTLLSILGEAELKPAFESAPLTNGLAGQLAAIELDVDLPLETVNRAIVVWSQLFGMLSFELFGQFVGSVDPTDEFFAHATGQMADFVGLP